jgi:Type IV secretory pathway, protease TraF
MKPRIAFVLAGASIIPLLLAVETAGFRLNVTESAPLGLWFLDKSKIPERGSLVSFCPPSTRIVMAMVAQYYLRPGDCIGTGSYPLLKAVSAVSGDSVEIRDGMPALVNGKELPNTVAQNKSLAWPSGSYQVAPGYVWVFSTYNEKSFDSRYFGPVPIENVRGLSFPVLVDGNTDNMKKEIPHA